MLGGLCRHLRLELRSSLVRSTARRGWPSSASTPPPTGCARLAAVLRKMTRRTKTPLEPARQTLDRHGPPFAGFCVGGYNWPAPELAPSMDPGAALDIRRSIAVRDAQLTRDMGGNLIRSFWSVESVIQGVPEDLALALNALARGDLRNTSVFMQTLEQRVAQLDRCDVVLDQLLDALSGDQTGPIRLDFETMDAVLAGLAEANVQSSERVGVLLALVSIPPRWIIEAPSDATLAHLGRPYTFATLWDRYVRFHAGLHRLLVVRYAVERPLSGLCALEIVNEPDYMWTPEETKIEWGADALLNPLGKYVTELQLAQVPTGHTPYLPFEKTAWGFQEQDAIWASKAHDTTPVLRFDWGPKFDWYVKCFAELQAHVAWAIKDEATKHSVDVSTVSGSVTHNNIDYLLRVHRADPRAFAHIDKIGLHPYHWLNNDVWNTEFVTAGDVAGWETANPREFAGSRLKRFDFLRAFSEPSGDQMLDDEIKEAFGGRKLWLTEFGIGSKLMGAFNAPIAEHTRFIRPRQLVGGTGGEADVVWEDMWSTFLDQVGDSWLGEHQVECVLLYALRELGMPGFDLDDDDRSNFALFLRDGTPRVAPPIIDRIGELFQGLTGRAPSTFADPSVQASPMLFRRPWRDVQLPDSARDVVTMLSIEERQLLFWLTSSYRTGEGAIVDGGCFVGGSTIPLAEGLRAGGVGGTVDVYDLFQVEPYMTDFYFKDEDLQAGDSFRPLFDHNTANVSSLLRVHEGDLMQVGWSGDPIEILFVDFAKSWHLNDFIVQSFFPRLIPGRSIVVQQDYVFAGCPWVALTMEYLSDYFEPVAFAEYCSVVYRCRQEIPRNLTGPSELPHERRLELMDRAIARFRGYPRAVLDCAKAVLLIEHGNLVDANEIVEQVTRNGPDHYSVRAAIELCQSLVEGRVASN
jgi:hypothetical protein